LLGSGRAAGNVLAASTRISGAAARASRATAHGARAAARAARRAVPTFSCAALRAAGAATGSLDDWTRPRAPACTGTATTGLFDGAAAYATGAAARTASPGRPEHGCGDQADHEEPGDDTTDPTYHVSLRLLHMPIHVPQGGPPCLSLECPWEPLQRDRWRHSSEQYLYHVE
jgi:hypothetical protein